MLQRRHGRSRGAGKRQFEQSVSKAEFWRRARRGRESRIIGVCGERGTEAKRPFWVEFGRARVRVLLRSGRGIERREV